jgi:uncharacterized membrane protein
MSEEKNNNTPVTNPGGSDQAPEDALADKLAEQADAVTSGLRDLLPDSRGTGLPATYPIEPAADAAETPGETLVPDEASVAGAVPTEPPAASVDSGTSESVAAVSPAATHPDLPREVSSAAPGAQLESSSDDRLMSALAWLTLVLLQLPIVSVIQLLSPTTKDRPFQRNHAITSLLFFAAAMVYEVVAAIVYMILGALTLGCGYACLWVIFFLPHALGLYYALQAYNGKTIELPVLSNFGRQQGWM